MTRRRRTPPCSLQRQRGIALLAAILLVALGTILAASIAFENAMTARRGIATLAVDESLLVAEGAEALAAYALREDVRDSAETDHPAEIWGRPLGPVEIVPNVVLEARVHDLQGRFNLNSLVHRKADGQIEPDEDAVQVLGRLLEKLEIEPKWAQLIADWVDPDTRPEFPDGGEDNLYSGQNPPYRTPNLPITSTSELLALPEFGRERYLKLAPFVTALPAEVKLNVCSAPGLVLDAFIPGREEFAVDPEQLAKNRAGGCFPRKESDYKNAFDSSDDYDRIADRLVEKSSYFRLTSFITIGTAEFTLYSLLQRENDKVRPIQRSFAAE